MPFRGQGAHNLHSPSNLIGFRHREAEISRVLNLGNRAARKGVHAYALPGRRLQLQSKPSWTSEDSQQCCPLRLSFLRPITQAALLCLCRLKQTTDVPTHPLQTLLFCHPHSCFAFPALFSIFWLQDSTTSFTSFLAPSPFPHTDQIPCILSMACHLIPPHGCHRPSTFPDRSCLWKVFMPHPTSCSHQGGTGAHSWQSRGAVNTPGKIQPPPPLHH